MGATAEPLGSTDSVRRAEAKASGDLVAAATARQRVLSSVIDAADVSAAESFDIDKIDSPTGSVGFTSLRDIDSTPEKGAAAGSTEEEGP